jgi:hypothetical protein
MAMQCDAMRQYGAMNYKPQFDWMNNESILLQNMIQIRHPRSINMTVINEYDT